MRLRICFFIFILLSSTNGFSQLKTVWQFKSAPAGGEVWVNNQKIGVTPLKIELDSEVLNISIRKNGYKEYQVVLTNSEAQKLFVRFTSTNSHYTFLKEIKTLSQPKDIIYTEDGRNLLIVNLNDIAIQVYDTQTGGMRRIDVPKIYQKDKGLVEGIFNQDGSEFWFNQMAEKGRVFVVNTQDWTIKTNIVSRGNWTKVGEFSPDWKYYYVSNWLSDDVSIIDAKTYQFVRKFKVYGKAPRGIAFSEDGKYVYVTMFDSGETCKFDIADNYKLVKRVTTGGSNGRFRIDPVRKVAYINNLNSWRLYVWDLNTDTIIKTLPVWCNPNNVKISPDYRYIYVSNRGPNGPKGYLYRSPEDGRITVFDAASNYKVVEEIPTGNQPIGIAVTPDGKTLAISNFMDDTIDFFRIDL